MQPPQLATPGERRDHRDLLLVAGLAVIAAANALLWACTIPFNEAPDEAAHFQVVRFVLDHGRLPVFSPDELWLLNTSKGVVESYATFPPLAYLVGALASGMTDGTMWGARLVSVVSYVATVILAFLTARRVFPGSRLLAVCVATVVAFLPQFAFTGAYVNSDAIGVALSTLLVYLLLRLQPDASPAWLVLATSVTAGALLLTKYTFYPVAGIGLAVAAWWVRRRPLPEAALLLGVVGTAGWWFARNWVLYGEPVAVRVIADAKAAAGGNTLFVPADYGITLLDISWRTDFWWASLTSFVGKFGFISIELHPAYYIACLALVGLALVGAAVRLRRGGSRPVDWGRVGIGIALFLGTALFAMFSSASGEYSPQGRYLFAALVPIAIGLVAGWSWPGDLAPAFRLVPLAAAMAIGALNFIALFGYIVPAYFEGAERVVVQIDPPATPREIAGWAFVEGVVGWRPFSPASVSEYRVPASDVRIYADAPPPSGRLLGTARYGLPRPDVAAFYGGFRSLDEVGYRLNLAAEDLREPGILYVCASGGTAIETCVVRDLPPVSR